jgi:hypothetical protein
MKSGDESGFLFLNPKYTIEDQISRTDSPEEKRETKLVGVDDGIRV